MKKYILILFAFIGSFANAQDYEQLCLDCVEQNGFYCGDDPANWTQYAPMGCVPNGQGGLMYLNDGWEDCVDGSDENGAVPTTATECTPLVEGCDTVYVNVIEYIFETDTVDVPFYIYETIIQTDTIYDIEYITQIVIDTFEIETFVPEYVYVTDTVFVYEDVLDTLYVDIVEYVEVEITIFDTIIETEYVEFVVYDTIVEYETLTITEYIDCDSGLPCNSSIMEIVDKSNGNSVIYNIQGQAVLVREGLYIENGKIYYKTK